MGLRQHPGPLGILGCVLLVSAAASCTFTPYSTKSLASLAASQGSIPGQYSTNLRRPTPESPSAAALGSTPIPASTPAPPPDPSPLALAMQRASSYYERGLQAMRTGNADQAEWEFDAALEALVDTELRGQAPSTLLITARPTVYPTSPWLSGMAAPQQSLAPEPPTPADLDEPTLEAPALLGPEDLKAVTEPQSDGRSAIPEPESQKYDVPIVFNEQVKTFIQYFQSQKWGVITRAFERASRYLPMMRKIFREHDLPGDLLNLAFIESAVNPRATSRAKAAGIWQFIPSTGRLYGMRTSWWLDERRDPEKSTRGAAAYLKNLYGMFESWPLALAAYNAGEGKIQSAIQRQRTRDFWSLRLPKETQLFVPAFMAMTIISREPERYGFSPPPDEPWQADTIFVQHPTDLRVIAQAARTTVEEIRDLNPALIRWATPPDLNPYTLRIPAGSRDDFLEALARIPPTQRLPWVRHQIHKGETPASIARRYRVDLATVLEMNGLRKRQALKPGAVLLLPPSGLAAAAAQADGTPRPSQSAARPAISDSYTVKKGDSLGRIARAHAVSADDLRRWNNLSRDARLRPGHVLKISRPAEAKATPALQSRPRSAAGKAHPAPHVKRYVVKRGDTIGRIARAHAVSADDLRRWNNLSRDAELRPGQALQVTAPAS